MLQWKLLPLFLLLVTYAYAEDKMCPMKGGDAATNTKETNCGGSFFHTYECCGLNFGDCCFALTELVYIAFIISTALALLVGILSCLIKFLGSGGGGGGGRR
uniref:Uncharacterized protein n=1 Tax=Caenorhabditis japonica TaxID=281687 RepID=A0A8R1HRE1_CAEJA